MAFLNSLVTSSSSHMLLISEWSASKATGTADLKISAGIPSIPGDFPERVCLIAFETSSIVGEEVEAGDNWLVWVLDGPTLCPPPPPPSHRSGDSDVTDVSAATDGIVNQIPLFRSGVHPCCFVLICLTEQCAGDGEAILSTETQQHEAV